MTNSSTAGYLVPSSVAPANDAALEDILHDLVVGCTGMDRTMVRPRWQAIVPKQPEPSTDWCAIGVQSIDRLDGPAIMHAAAGQGTDTLVRDEIIEAIASFYGPNGQGNASLMRDGVSIPQNFEVIGTFGLSLVDSSQITIAPALINQQWVRRYDLRLTFSRQVTRVYPILNLLSADGTIESDTGTSQPFIVEP